ncbi:hypothetical protein FEU62_003143 [Escherichia coli]|nr:hypothetical protein [Escherichia coli]EIG4854503.1 hypothetical protein [Escherichia coli]EIG4859248.1 hypothetical protein [Escherichia coli]EIG4870015.1 hypothetical protein [Escherichia coli]
MTNRISRLKTALFSNTREISLERALLYTASHRQTEGEPVILRLWGSDQFWVEFVQPGRTCKPCVARGVVIQCDSGRICEK